MKTAVSAWIAAREAALDENLVPPDGNLALAGKPSFSLGNRLERLAWIVTWRLFASWTPSFLRPWRRFLLGAFGAKMAPSSDVRGTARVWLPRNLLMEESTILAGGVNCYNMAPIAVLRGAIVSQGAVLCCGSHDVDDPSFPLVARSIVVGQHAWIASEAFVGPGVIVGDGAVLGARAVTFSDLQPWHIHVGNPAKPRRKRRCEDRFSLSGALGQPAA